jgi:hypothetical protein
LGRLAGVLAVLAAAIAIPACGEKAEPETGSSTATPPELPTGADEVVLEVFSGGGYVPLVSMRREFPAAVLYGDGRLVTAVESESEEEPAVPELEVTRLDETEVDELVSAAQEAGVGEGIDYGTPEITDLPTTTVTLRTTKGTEEASVYGLGFEDADTSVSAEQEDARMGLNEFIDSLLAHEGEPFDPGAYVVTSIATTGPGPGGVEWPLEADRFASGKRSEVCTIVDGRDAEELVKAARDAALETVWSEGRAQAEVAIKPAIGHDMGCPEGVPEA